LSWIGDIYNKAKTGYGDVTHYTKKIGIDPIGHATDPIGNLPGGIGNPQHADLGPINNATQRAFNTQDTLSAERAGFQNPNAPQMAVTGLDQTMIAGDRRQQQAAINQLFSASQGQTPSVAELQAARQSQLAGGQQFGMAAALQGGMSAGGALRGAQQGAAGLQGDAIANGEILRAQEMANARNALVGATSGLRGQEQDLAGANANLIANANQANLQANLQNNAQALDWRKALLSGQLESQGQGIQGAVGATNASAADAAASNTYKGGLLKTGASAIPLIGSLL